MSTQWTVRKSFVTFKIVLVALTNNMAQGPFILNLAWESQYFRTVFIFTRMEIAAVHEVQLAVEGEEDLLYLTHLPNPSFFLLSSKLSSSSRHPHGLSSELIYCNIRLSL